jgi:signal transduction histidine kinase
LKNWSLRTRILFTTTSVVLTLALVLVVVMTYFMNSLTDRILLRTLRPLAKIAAQSLEGNLHMLADRLLLLRDNAVIVDPGATQAARQAVLDMTKSGIEFLWLALYRPDGRLQTGSGNSPADIQAWKLYSMLNHTENLVIADTIIGLDELQIVMGVPVSHNGTTISFLVGSYPYDVLNDILSNINIASGGSAFIVNEEGGLMAHRDVKKVHEGESFKIKGFGGIFQDLLAQIKLGQTGAVSLESPRGKRFFSYAPIRGTRWALAIETPRSDFMDAAWNAIVTSFVITAALLVLFLIFFNLFVKNVLAEPLRLITFNAHKLALGSYIQKLPEKIMNRRDEIGQLGGAFLSMSDSIKNVIRVIERLTEGARNGRLSERGEFFSLYGDYQHIILGVNTALEVICSHFDAVPEALALFGESQKFLYANRAMNGFLLRHGFDAADPGLLARIVSSGASGELEPRAAALFGPDGKDLGIYTASVELQPYNYTLSLQRTYIKDGRAAVDTDALAAALAALGGTAPAREADTPDVVSVMLILSDVTLLTRAKVDAEAASQAKSNFLANMSHEIRTPMNAIIGMTNIARSASADMEKKEYCLAKINQAANHLLGVIGDILDMSKIEAEKFELSVTEFDFEKMIRRITDVIGFRVEKKNLTFTLNIDTRIPPVLIGDDQRLAQVITNLLGNAVKFTPEGGRISFTACLDEETSGVCTIRMETADTGIGISAEQQAHLFASFQQADGGISRKFGGTGLGLAISKRILEMMGGSIRIDSELGKGSRFIFTVKLKRSEKKPEELAQDGAEAEPDTGEASKADNFEGRRIILAEDVEINREIVLNLLEPTLLKIDCAENGVQALSLFTAASGQYDMIFMDVHMPEMDGYEATRRLRALDIPKAKTIPIVAMTANVFREDVEKCLRAGMNDHIGKPIDFEMVLAKLRKYLPKK